MSVVDDGVAVKGFRDGTDREISPAGTVARMTPLLASMGITRVANVTGLDHLGLPVFVACRPNSRGLATAQGKGLNADAARASAIMEATESFHAERIDHPLIHGSWRELSAGRPLLDPVLLRTFRGPALSPDHRLLWIEGRDLMAGQPMWVPFDLVHCDLSSGLMGRSPFQVSSNGLASGNNLLEATSHATCELIERDAMAWLTTLPDQERARRRVDPATVDDPGCRTVLGLLEAAGSAAAIWEATCDLGLPVFAVDIADNPALALRPIGTSRGQGCHPRREIALLRALTEAVQSRLTLISGGRDDLPRTDYQQATDLRHCERAWRVCAGKDTPRAFRAAPHHDFATFGEDIGYQLKVLESAGIRHAVRVDLTRPELGVAVVRMVIPQLEAYLAHRGHVPGPRARRWLAMR